MKVMSQLEVHGIAVERIVVTEPLEQLSPRAVQSLLDVERASSVRIDWLVELMRLGGKGHAAVNAREALAIGKELPSPILERQRTASLGRYSGRREKRAFDIICAVVLLILLLPVLLITGLLVAADVGFPLVFWQKRPGRSGRPFKLFKFRTMRPAHDAMGVRIPDDQRSSKVGRLLRRTRLDELPQLYNIIIGEMSFVGPRPLLPADQPFETGLRLAVRPGLTGLAQVCGGRDMAAEDKNALDVWYAQNASLWLDIKILFRTMIVVVRGERLELEHDVLHIARAELLRSLTREERAA
jgi:lipopolysaccharide/colanic/teichoic acid biosynthesis glycosyltransferase